LTVRLETPGTLKHGEWLGGEIIESGWCPDGRSNAVTAENEDLLDFRIVDGLRGKKRKPQQRA